MSERRTVYKDASTGVGGLGPSQSQTYVDGTKLMGQQYGHAAKEIADLVTTDPIIPIGVVNPFAGGSAPSGWLLCDGAEVSQVTYPTLYALILATWGTAASGQFKLPDLRGRVITGADGGAGRIASNNALGDDGGAEDVSLTTAQIPSHTHTNSINSNASSSFASGAWNMYIDLVTTGTKYYNYGTSGSYPFIASAPNNALTIDTTDASYTNANTGGGTSHSNLQPYAILNHIIKHD